MNNTNITKNYLKFRFFPKILIYLKTLKIVAGEISWNNIRSDLAVRWLSLISIKSEQVSKICSMVKRLSHPMHTGGSSPFNKKDLGTSNKRMANVQSGHHSLFFSVCPRTKKYILLTLGISYIIYFPGTHPTQTATVLIYIYLCVVLGLRTVSYTHLTLPTSSTV